MNRISYSSAAKRIGTNVCLALFTAFFAVLSLGWLNQSFALSDDRDQAIEFRADEAVHDELNGTLTYTGSVYMQQGSMIIRADKIVVYGNQEAVSKIEAIGRPVSLSQQPKPRAEPIEAKAERLVYNISNDSIQLLGRASLSQEGSSLSGDQINYDVRRSVVRARGKSDSTSGKDGRIRMVIPPKALKKAEEDS